MHSLMVIPSNVNVFIKDSSILCVRTKIQFKITGQFCHVPLQKIIVLQIAIKYV
jgi:hypothetical protein